MRRLLRFLSFNNKLNYYAILLQLLILQMIDIVDFTQHNF